MKDAWKTRSLSEERKCWRHSLLAGLSLLQREMPPTEHSEREGKRSVGVSEHGISLSLPPSQPPHSRPLAPSLPSTLLLCVTVHMSPEQKDDDERGKFTRQILSMNLYSYDKMETLCCVVKLSFSNVLHIFRYTGCVSGHSLVPLSSNSIAVYIFYF